MVLNRVDQVDALLPQTQCTRCGYPDCRTYAEAIVETGAEINRCPPGGSQGIARLAQVVGVDLAAHPHLASVNTECGIEGPVRLAVIDEDWCIGCTLCIKACPVDCIIGTHKRMHTIIEAECTGCELCVPVCPVDCISLVDVTPGRTGWQAWSPEQATDARQRYIARDVRQQRAAAEHATRLEAKAEHKLVHLDALTRDNNPSEIDRKRAVIEAALARARAKRDKV